MSESSLQSITPPPAKVDHYPRMTALAQSFPCLVDGRDPVPGVCPFNAVELSRQYGTAASGRRHAIRFLLTLFNGNGRMFHCKQGGKRTDKNPEGNGQILISPSHWSWLGGGYTDEERVGLVPPFDGVDALSCWDEGNRAAYLAWAQKPWWP